MFIPKIVWMFGKSFIDDYPDDYPNIVFFLISQVVGEYHIMFMFFPIKS